METTELILKLGWIGWTNNLSDFDPLLNWLYKEYGIYIEKEGKSFNLIFQNHYLCRYYNITRKDDIIKYILPDVTLLWKCCDGNLDGPSLDNYEEPNIEWT